MFGGVLSWLGYFPLKYWYNDEIPDRVGMRHHLLTPYGPHETADDQLINFAILSQAHWVTFCHDVIERPDFLDDDRFETNEKRVTNRNTFEPLLEEIIARESRDHWAERLEAAGIPWGDVNQIDDVLDHPQTEHLDMIREIETEKGPIKVIDNPLEMGELDIRRDAMPTLGEDTIDILHELGYDRDVINELESREII
jgi:itaconate CoA-transferase